MKGLENTIFRTLHLPMVFCCFLSTEVSATHLRAADIIVERTCGTLTFRITVIAYMNSLSQSQFGTNSEVIFGDGSMVKIPLTSSTPRPDLGVNIRVATFTTTHTYASSGIYTITYIERDRSSNVLNIANSHDVPYVTFVKINTDPNFECNRFPTLSVIPLDRGCSKVAFFHSPGAFDLDGDSLSYELSVPASSENTFAIYVDPNDSKFYTNFNAGNEAANGSPIFTIDKLTGLITWDAPGAAGEYNIAFKVVEWRKNASGNYTQLSATTRDMQIVIEQCANQRPDIIIPEDLCVVAGTQVNILVKGTDAEKHPVRIEVFSEILLFDETQNPATYSPIHNDFVSSDPPAEMVLQWNSTCDHVRQQSYQVVFKITDKPPDGPKLVTFKTWSVRVVAPSPNLTVATLDVIGKKGIINWEGTGCENASTLQVWRKVDSFNYTPNSCQTGIPSNSGYQLIDEVDPVAGSYVDSNFGMGLSPGAMYCYRLVARIADTKSLVSIERCIGPVRPDAPVITHVSMIETADTGKIRVSWRSPFEINKEQFPEPYQYEIYRAYNFAGDSAIVKAGLVSDTTFVDENINTNEHIFNYRVVLYSKPQFSDTFVPIDTSAVAASVRLMALPGEDQIMLHWEDSIPWSNVSQARPWHLIYRASGIRKDYELMLYDSVNVISDGFNYIDRNVVETEIYTYKILTRGSYGNPRIALQENYSQIVSTYPENDLLPCSPLVTINNVNCDDYLQSDNCGQTTFANSFEWTNDDSSPCRIDIETYNIYVSNGMDTVYALLKNVSATSFQDNGLPSFARCYKVAAVDRDGIEGPKSTAACNDNCPYFMLPNVFTPGTDGCNDLFTSRFEREGIPNCLPNNVTGCPRFVQSVSLHVYNRWGKEVYQYSSSDNDSINIDWNGKDNNGNDLATGVYYYVAEVEFNMLDPQKRKKTYKDWVHLVR